MTISVFNNNSSGVVWHMVVWIREMVHGSQHIPLSEKIMTINNIVVYLNIDKFD